ncbi:SDR family oxidoreductase [Streptomyces sp. SID13031]|uniref:SDR family oxidoreductase n=1 Tax=Streptomyces sp. SID13031 TaxID=2706046 RepID=UPI0013C5A03C|nr:SDR family oxidoreductase [Streptomyces sp. SID13031]NEA36013.1 SDR family oxidoreductase [Streptomyces sp. SID13031]
MSIVITGATGQLGRLVIADLLAAGVPADGITAVARTKEKAADLAAQGVKIAIADYDEPASFADVFSAGDRVLLISGSEPGRRIPQHTAVIDAAKTAGVAQLAYTGIFGGPNNKMLLGADHQATEQLILDSGVPSTFLRNNWYSELAVRDIPAAIESGAIVNAAGPEARLATATREDYAAAAAVVLTTDSHLDQAYDLGGDEAWSFAEFAAELSRQTGKPVVHQVISHDDLLAGLLSAGIPEAFAEVLADIDTQTTAGALSATPNTLSQLIGRPTTPIATTITKLLS